MKLMLMATKSTTTTTKNTCKYMELMYDVEKESEKKHQQTYEKGNACKRRERIQIEWFTCVHHKICISLRKATYCET